MAKEWMMIDIDNANRAVRTEDNLFNPFVNRNTYIYDKVYQGEGGIAFIIRWTVYNEDGNSFRKHKVFRFIPETGDLLCNDILYPNHIAAEEYAVFYAKHGEWQGELSQSWRQGVYKSA